MITIFDPIAIFNVFICSNASININQTTKTFIIYKICLFPLIIKEIAQSNILIKAESKKKAYFDFTVYVQHLTPIFDKNRAYIKHIVSVNKFINFKDIKWAKVIKHQLLT